MFGEIVRGLHATLDNLVFALGFSKRNKIRPDDRSSAYPILLQPNDWFTEKTAGKLRYIDVEDRAKIDLTQPFTEDQRDRAAR